MTDDSQMGTGTTVYAHRFGSRRDWMLSPDGFRAEQCTLRHAGSAGLSIALSSQLPGHFEVPVFDDLVLQLVAQETAVGRIDYDSVFDAVAGRNQLVFAPAKANCVTQSTRPCGNTRSSSRSRR